MYFQNDDDNLFSIYTPSPLKMGAKLGNIKAQISPKIGFLDFCEKIESLVFARNDLK